MEILEAQEINIHQAKTQLSRLIEAVQLGKEIVIAKAGRPVAKLVRWDGPDARRVLGSAEGLIEFREGWDAPMTAQELEEFLGA